MSRVLTPASPGVRVHRSLAVVAALGLVLVRCSSGASENQGPPSDDSGSGHIAFVDPYGGATGCDGGVPIDPNLFCQISMPLGGGLSGTVTGTPQDNCGYYVNPQGTLASEIDGTGVAPWRDINVILTSAILPGRIGTFGSVAIQIQASAADGGGSIWKTPATCSLDLASNACGTGLASPVPYYVISGTGRCPDPAAFVAATPGLTDAGVTIGDFSFALLIQGPSSADASDQ
ncbi:MAG: hypothetical protein ACREJ3_10740 [Polyangiaceae bacterium]